VNEIYLKYHGNEEREFTTPAIYRQEFIVLVPESAQIHVWVVVYQALRSFRRPHLLLSFFSCVLLWYLLRLFGAKRDKATSKTSLSKSVVVMSAIFLNMPLSFLTKTKSTSQRLLLSSCLISSLSLIGKIEGFSLDVVTNPHFDTNTVTLQQLEQTGPSIFTDNYNLLDTFYEKESVGR
jgi:predicted neutral ceramidase superfamily lipid hydrolase